MIFAAWPAHGRRPDVDVWGDTVLTQDLGTNAAAWFTAALGCPCRVVPLHREPFVF